MDSPIDALMNWLHELFGGTRPSDVSHMVPGGAGHDVAQQVAGQPPAPGTLAAAQEAVAHDPVAAMARQAVDDAAHGRVAPGAGAVTNTLGTINASDQITNSVGESMQQVADSNAASAARVAADQANIDAAGVSQAAAKAIDDAKEAL